MTTIPEQDKSIVNAKPTKDLFISILVRDISIRDAIGDLLDNSVDGALRLRPKGDYKGLWAKISFDAKNGSFTIHDNCGGIPIKVARDYAFRFGRPEGADTTEHSVGAFGIGMKRALFRLGKKFTVESVAQKSSFKLEVDVDEWKKDESLDSWTYRFKEFVEDEKHPIEERGTKITVTNLLPDVLSFFGTGSEVGNLIHELQREHLYSIDQGLEITVNGTLLEAQELKLLASDEFKTAYWENLDGPVKVRIYAGISEQEHFGPNGGWYIFCNKRLVLGPDQTKVTGWGVQRPIGIPEYHSQFYRFRGYVFLDADDPRDLPWNTTKTSMEQDSSIYQAVFQQMVILLRSVVDFLNQLHREEQDYQKEKINETPSGTAIKKAQSVPLSVVRQNQTYLSPNKFVYPKPAKPKKPAPTQIQIRYSVLKERYESVREYFELDRPEDIGLATFDYFFEREIRNGG